MLGWKEYKLSDLCELMGGGTPKTSVPDYWNGSIPWLSVTDFNTGKKYCFDAEKKITERGLKESSTKILKKGQIIISARGTVGVIAMLGNDMAFNQSNYGINANDGLTTNDFLYYLLKDNISQFISNSYGAVFDTITKQTFEQITIELPPLPEQRAIAEVLSSLDDKIDLLHRQNNTLEALADTLFRQWFIQEAEEGWEVGNILKYCSHNKETINPQRFPNTEFIHFSIPSFDDNKNPVIEKGSKIQSNKYIVYPNCILFSKLNPHKDKRVWLIPNEVDSNSICSTEFQIIKPKNKKYLYFLLGWLTVPQNYNEIAAGVGGTSGSHQRIDPSDIFSFDCPIVPDVYIEKYNQAIEPIFIKKHNNRKQIRTLTQLRDTLLPKLMSGEVRVKG